MAGPEKPTFEGSHDASPEAERIVTETRKSLQEIRAKLDTKTLTTTHEANAKLDKHHAEIKEYKRRAVAVETRADMQEVKKKVEGVELELQQQKEELKAKQKDINPAEGAAKVVLGPVGKGMEWIGNNVLPGLNNAFNVFNDYLVKPIVGYTEKMSAGTKKSLATLCDYMGWPQLAARLRGTKELTPEQKKEKEVRDEYVKISDAFKFLPGDKLTLAALPAEGTPLTAKDLEQMRLFKVGLKGNDIGNADVQKYLSDIAKDVKAAHPGETHTLEQVVKAMLAKPFVPKSPADPESAKKTEAEKKFGELKRELVTVNIELMAKEGEKPHETLEKIDIFERGIKRLGSGALDKIYNELPGSNRKKTATLDELIDVCSKIRA